MLQSNKMVGFVCKYLFEAWEMRPKAVMLKQFISTGLHETNLHENKVEMQNTGKLKMLEENYLLTNATVAHKLTL